MKETIKPFVLLGAGGHGRVICDILHVRESPVFGFLDDNSSLLHKSVMGIPILGTCAKAATLCQEKQLQFLPTIGDNHQRARWFERLRTWGAEIGQAIHPHAVLARDIELGEGAVVMAGSLVNTGVHISEDVCVNTGAIIDHDCHLGPHSHVFPGARLTGNVRIGAYAYIGTGASILPGISIGAHAFVGAGAVVTKDVPDYAVVVGVPAKISRINEPM